MGKLQKEFVELIGVILLSNVFLFVGMVLEASEASFFLGYLLKIIALDIFLFFLMKKLEETS